MPSNWSQNNAAHAFTWIDLRALFELPASVSFPDAEAFPTQQLLFYTQTGSAAMKLARAKRLADMLDRLYRLAQGARMESGKTSAQAKKAMVEVLMSDKGTVGKLGRLVDDFYRFHNEG